MEMESLRWELKQKVDVITTLEVDMNVLQEMLIEDLQMEQELELTKAVAWGLQEELDIRNNEPLMLRKQLEVAQAVANESDEVAAEARLVFLMSLKAGGVALNLTVASHVFLMDPWWNPALEQQAQDRIHFLGQYKPMK
ncbi:unnamed protein product [Sphagnum balticum]